MTGSSRWRPSALALPSEGAASSRADAGAYSPLFASGLRHLHDQTPPVSPSFSHDSTRNNTAKSSRFALPSLLHRQRSIDSGSTSSGRTVRTAYTTKTAPPRMLDEPRRSPSRGFFSFFKGTGGGGREKQVAMEQLAVPLADSARHEGRVDRYPPDFPSLPPDPGRTSRFDLVPPPDWLRRDSAASAATYTPGYTPHTPHASSYGAAPASYGPGLVPHVYGAAGSRPTSTYGQPPPSDAVSLSRFRIVPPRTPSTYSDASLPRSVGSYPRSPDARAPVPPLSTPVTSTYASSFDPQYAPVANGYGLALDPGHLPSSSYARSLDSRKPVSPSYAHSLDSRRLTAHAPPSSEPSRPASTLSSAASSHHRQSSRKDALAALEGSRGSSSPRIRAATLAPVMEPRPSTDFLEFASDDEDEERDFERRMNSEVEDAFAPFSAYRKPPPVAPSASYRRKRASSERRFSLKPPPGQAPPALLAERPTGRSFLTFDDDY